MIIAKESIRHNGKVYAVNAKIEDINDKDAERLVNLGVAFYPETIIAPAGNNDDGSNDSGHIDLTPEEAAAELDSLFDYNGLKEAATVVGLEFAGNISKANLIALILDQGKAEAVFDLAEEE